MIEKIAQISGDETATLSLERLDDVYAAEIVVNEAGRYEARIELPQDVFEILTGDYAPFAAFPHNYIYSEEYLPHMEVECLSLASFGAELVQEGGAAYYDWALVSDGGGQLQSMSMSESHAIVWGGFRGNPLPATDAEFEDEDGTSYPGHSLALTLPGAHSVVRPPSNHPEYFGGPVPLFLSSSVHDTFSTAGTGSFRRLLENELLLDDQTVVLSTANHWCVIGGVEFPQHRTWTTYEDTLQMYGIYGTTRSWGDGDHQPDYGDHGGHFTGNYSPAHLYYSVESAGATVEAQAEAFNIATINAAGTLFARPPRVEVLCFEVP